LTKEVDNPVVGHPNGIYMKLFVKGRRRPCRAYHSKT